MGVKDNNKMCDFSRHLKKKLPQYILLYCQISR